MCCRISNRIVHGYDYEDVWVLMPAQFEVTEAERMFCFLLCIASVCQRGVYRT